MSNRKILAGAAMAGALAVGGALGVALGTPGTSGASKAQSTASTTSTTTTTPNGEHRGGPPFGKGHKGFHGGEELDAAAKVLGLSAADLRTELQSGKSLADVAKEKGVEKQKVVDALVTTAAKELDDEKAQLPEEMAAVVDRKLPGDAMKDHPGGHGHGPDGQGHGRFGGHDDDNTDDDTTTTTGG